MNKQKFGNVELGQWELEDLYKETIDLSMNQNAGLALAKINKIGFNNTPERKILNDQLNNIMVLARREMRKRIQDYLEAYSKLNCPAS